jgi:hypothetical protein
MRAGSAGHAAITICWYATAGHDPADAAEGQTHPLTWPPQKTLPPSVTVWKSIDFRQTLARLSCPEESEMVAGFLQKAN